MLYMRYKAYPIQIWFLDNDLEVSATLLPDKMLQKTILGCMQALIAARFYVYGIRSMRFHKYYFDKVRKVQTLDHLFPLWPFRKTPSFQKYGTQTSKWCRKCKEHYEYVKRYFGICLLEYESRFGKQHAVVKFEEWNDVDAPLVKIPEAHLSKVIVPWKVLPIKYRSRDILSGYRKYLKSILDRDGGVKVGDYTGRDIPEFLLEESVLSQHMI